MITSSIIKSPIQNAIKKLFPGSTIFRYGVPLFTLDGDIIYTSDGAVLLISGVTANSSSPPNTLYITTDGDALITTNNSALTV